MPMQSIGFMGLQAGDRVSVRRPQGHIVSGKVNAMLIFDDRVVLNIGGKHGQPLVVNDESVVVKIQRKKQ